MMSSHVSLKGLTRDVDSRPRRSALLVQTGQLGHRASGMSQELIGCPSRMPIGE